MKTLLNYVFILAFGFAVYPIHELRNDAAFWQLETINNAKWGAYQADRHAKGAESFCDAGESNQSMSCWALRGAVSAFRDYSTSYTLTGRAYAYRRAMLMTENVKW